MASAIAQGWKNVLMPKKGKKELIEAIAHRRLEICRRCPFNSKNGNYKGFRPDEHCTKCGCTLAAKTRSLGSECPVGKWESVISDQ